MDAVCAVCLKETPNFDEYLDNALDYGGYERIRLAHSFVFSENDKWAAHGACLGVEAKDVIKKTV